jgi:hypothetical protein
VAQCRTGSRTGSRIDAHSKVRPSALGSAMYAPTRSRRSHT